MDNKYLALGAAALLLMGGAAAVASYATRESMQAEVTPVAEPVSKPKPKKHVSTQSRQQVASAQPQPVQQAPQEPACDDKNIVGTVGGGVAGGLVGSQIGKGNGNTAAIIGGVAGGALLGNQYIPTRGVLCR